MKVKILLVPLIIVICVALSIWLVYPAYSNGNNGLKEQRNNLKIEQDKLAKIKNKGQKAEELYAQISSLSSEKDILYNFIPDNMREEKIVDDLNYFATSNGLLVYEITVNQPKLESLNNFDSIQLTNNNLNSMSGISSEINAPIIPLPQAQSLKVEMKIIGSYENIKSFLINVDKMNRYNNAEIVEISNAQSSGNQTASPSVLTANLDIDFAVLKAAKITDANSLNNSIFSDESQLDTSIISKIKEKRTMNDFALAVDQKGKSNPFIP